MEVLKRGFDAALALLGLALLGPAFAVIAIRIRLCDGPPVLFSQRRVGRWGRPFLIYKFRSMRVEAPRLGGAVTAAGDKRITPTGRLLRRYKLDELPQLWNVLRGEMSLVGPRPEVPEYVDFADNRWREVLSVRPGLTSPASLAYMAEEQLLAHASNPGRLYRESILPAKLGLNLYYVRKRGFLYDLRLIAATLRRCVNRGPLARDIASPVLSEQRT